MELFQSVLQGAFIGVIMEKALIEQGVREQYRIVLIMIGSYMGDRVLIFLRQKVQKIIDRNE